MLLFAGAQILSGDVYDTIGINIKGNFNLGNSAGSGSNAVQLEETQLLIILGKLSFTLQNIYFYLRLAVGSSGEDLALLCLLYTSINKSMF